MCEIGFFFLPSKGERGQAIKTEDIEIGAGDGWVGLSISIYRTKTGRSKRGRFRELVGADPNVCQAWAGIFYLDSVGLGREVAMDVYRAT